MYAICCTNNISAQAARKAYGISNVTLLKQNVESAVEQAMEIRDAVNYLSSVKESCILEELGIHIDDSTSDCDASELSQTSESDGNDGCDDVNSEKDSTGILDPDIPIKEIAFYFPCASQ